jgi:pimeloyl-ACP methyl ester carboxylesterase
LAATWIQPVAEVAAQQIKAWGLTDGSKINLIGHSLGALLSSQMAQQFDQVNTITALEPPSDGNLFPGGYDLDGRQPGNQAADRFDAVSNFSRAFLGRQSTAGNPRFSAGADESILVNFGVRFDLGEEHFWVIETFKQVIQGKLANNLFSLDDLAPHPLFRSNAFTAGGNTVFEGRINTQSPDNILSFEALRSDTAGLDYVVYGRNDRRDILPGTLAPAIISDYLLGGGGNDDLLGNQGNDSLTGGAGNDKFIFDTGFIFNATLIGIDIIRDFVPDSDQIVLDKSTFFELANLPNGILPANVFASISSPTNGEQEAGVQSARIVFNSSTGDLYYNQNGSQSGLGLAGLGGRFANLVGINALSNLDFLIQA